TDDSDFEDIPNTGYVAANRHRIQAKTDAMTWHRRLGHPGEERLEKIVKRYTGMQIIGIPIHKCEACALAKATEVVSTAPAEKALTPFERVLMDRFDLTRSINGYKYAHIYKCEKIGYIF